MLPFSVFFIFFITCNALSKNILTDDKKSAVLSYLDVASEMISRAKLKIPSCGSKPSRRPVDCSDLISMGHKESGVYTIWPMNRMMEEKSLEVYCDMDTDGGGWTIIQRRGDFGRPEDYFFKQWTDYKEGFGNIQEDFWLGNDNIFALTNQKLYSIRFDLEDVEFKKAHAVYESFWIDDENNKYTLHISGYSGDAGDSIEDYLNNQKFSTKDQDNDSKGNENCAGRYKGAWWYNDCHSSNLNGLYLNGKHESYADGIEWSSWKGQHESLKSTEMKIRPKKFSLSK